MSGAREPLNGALTGLSAHNKTTHENPIENFAYTWAEVAEGKYIFFQISSHVGGSDHHKS